MSLSFDRQRQQVLTLPTDQFPAPDEGCAADRQADPPTGSL